MADRAALVTGASSGIGPTIAHMLGEEMIRTSDVAEAVRFALHVSPACIIPEIIFQRPGETA